MSQIISNILLHSYVRLIDWESLPIGQVFTEYTMFRKMNTIEMSLVKAKYLFSSFNITIKKQERMEHFVLRSRALGAHGHQKGQWGPWERICAKKAHKGP